jgi:membrane protein
MADLVASIKKFSASLKAAFLETGLEHGESALTPVQKFVHFWTLVTRDFLRNRCPVRATALAYTTLLALIPLIAVAVSVSTSVLKTKDGKPIEEMIEKLVETVAPQLDLVPKAGTEQSSRQQVVKSIRQFIDKISGGALGTTGMVGLVFVAIMMFITIESTFNDIWGVTRGRTWAARIIQYWATVTLGPLIPLLALALNTGTQVQAAQQWLARMPVAGTVLVAAGPFIVLSLAFAFFYQLMPNTRVRWQAALAGGIIGGSLWQLNSLFSVLYVSHVVSLTNLYGPLSLVPVFLIGLYFSWLILLFGAQVAYTFQNRAVYFQERQADSVNQLGREFIALRVMTLVGWHFQRGEKPLTGLEISLALGVPTRLTGQILQTLMKAGLLVQVTGVEHAYALGRPLEAITCHDILRALRTGQGRELDTHDDPARAAIRKEFTKIQHAEQAAAAGTLAALVQQSEPPARP